MAIPEAILRKPGPLTPDEWEVMRTHPEIGARILADMEFLGDAIEVVRSHHERWDGAGYPDGLAGPSIPLEARIIACCDTWNAMTTTRSYRAALPVHVAVREIRANAGTQFDADVVDAVLAVVVTDVPVADAPLFVG
jgi:HD-GYP domain-containing protein (c-di-GMP phosphodiesterase class II)